MSTSNSSAHGLATGKRLVTHFVVCEFFLIAGNLLARVCQRAGLLPKPVIAVLACAAALPMLFFAIRFFRLLRTDLDEMLQRMIMEGLAFAMVLFIPLAGLYVNARAAGLIQARLDPPELLMVPSILVVIGIWISWSRFK